MATWQRHRRSRACRQRLGNLWQPCVLGSDATDLTQDVSAGCGLQCFKSGGIFTSFEYLCILVYFMRHGHDPPCNSTLQMFDPIRSTAYVCNSLQCQGPNRVSPSCEFFLCNFATIFSCFMRVLFHPIITYYHKISKDTTTRVHPEFDAHPVISCFTLFHIVSDLSCSRPLTACLRPGSDQRQYVCGTRGAAGAAGAAGRLQNRDDLVDGASVVSVVSVVHVAVGSASILNHSPAAAGTCRLHNGPLVQVGWKEKYKKTISYVPGRNAY